MDEFSQAKERQDDLAAQERRHQRDVSRRCDWEDLVDRNFYRNEERRAARVELLDRLVPDRICPICRHLYLNVRVWVVSRRKKEASCRKCFQRFFPDPRKVVTVDSILFPEHETRFMVDAAVLQQAIAKSGLSTREFARRAGWSRGYQRKLESKEIRSVKESNASVILTVLREAGVVTKDVL